LLSQAIDDFMTALPGRYNPGRDAGRAASVQFHFTGADAADWTLEIDGLSCRTAPGTLADPAVTLTVDSADFMSLLSGDLAPMPAFMQGKLRLKGDVGLAMKLPGLFQK
jgi:putative sterol carrier protein